MTNDEPRLTDPGSVVQYRVIATNRGSDGNKVYLAFKNTRRSRWEKVSAAVLRHFALKMFQACSGSKLTGFERFPRVTYPVLRGQTSPLKAGICVAGCKLLPF